MLDSGVETESIIFMPIAALDGERCCKRFEGSERGRCCCGLPSRCCGAGRGNESNLSEARRSSVCRSSSSALLPACICIN